MDVQSLLQPTITSTTKKTLFTQEDETPEWSESIDAAKFALKACKMVLDTMTEGEGTVRIEVQEQYVSTTTSLARPRRDHRPVLVASSKLLAADAFPTALQQLSAVQ